MKFTVDPSVAAADLHMVGKPRSPSRRSSISRSCRWHCLCSAPCVPAAARGDRVKVEGGRARPFKTGVAGHMTLTTAVPSRRRRPATAVLAARDQGTGYTVDEPEVGLHAACAGERGRSAHDAVSRNGRPVHATAEATMAPRGRSVEDALLVTRAGLESVIGVRITTPALPFLGGGRLEDRALQGDRRGGWRAARASDPPPGQSRLRAAA